MEDQSVHGERGPRYFWYQTLKQVKDEREISSFSFLLLSILCFEALIPRMGPRKQVWAYHCKLLVLYIVIFFLFVMHIS